MCLVPCNIFQAMTDSLAAAVEQSGQTPWQSRGQDAHTGCCRKKADFLTVPRLQWGLPGTNRAQLCTDLRVRSSLLNDDGHADDSILGEEKCCTALHALRRVLHCINSTVHCAKKCRAIYVVPCTALYYTALRGSVLNSTARCSAVSCRECCTWKDVRMSNNCTDPKALPHCITLCQRVIDGGGGCRSVTALKCTARKRSARVTNSFLRGGKRVELPCPRGSFSAFACLQR